MRETDDSITINSELFTRGDDTGTSSTLNIFRMKDEDLYDENDEEYDGEEMERKPRKGRFKLGAIVVVSILLALIGVGGVAFGLSKASKVGEYEAKVKALTQTVSDRETTINELNATIAAKDAELEVLKNNGAKATDTKTDGAAKTDEKKDGAKTGFGVHGSSYKVTSSTGMNIRECASFECSVVASLGYGDTFEQYGEIIKNDDGSVWIEFMWDDGFGCIQNSDGSSYAELQ